MTVTTLVSVVIPTYNNKHSLQKTLESLCDQSLSQDNYEIIIIDDGSNDGTSEWISSNKGRYHSGLRHYYQENKGPAAARNLGIRYAHGEIVAFLDSDCVASHSWVEEITKGYDDGRVAGVGGRIKAVPTSKTVSRYYAYIKLSEQPFIDKTGILYVITSSASFRKACFNLVGGFDERYNFPGGEEPDLCYRLRKKGYYFKYNRNAVVYNSHKDNLAELLSSHFNYGKGEAFLALRKGSDYGSGSNGCVRYIFYLFCVVTKLVVKFVKSSRLLIKFFKIPFKAMRYYGEGLSVHNGLVFAFLDYATQASFIEGALFGYILGTLRGFRSIN